MTILVLLVLFAVIIAYEAPGLIKKKRWWDLAAFSVLMLLGSTLSFGLALDLPLPNPLIVVEAIFAPVTQYLDRLLLT
ncbi:MAG: hypothetical protein LRZ99_05305 [Desulfotomaculum sp.]|nr:hypothetical protein [Desulfotomaculum sp.]